MRLSCFALSVTAAAQESFAADNFGLNFTDCASDYFRPGAEWPLQDSFPAGSTVRLCQNRNGLDHYYATLFDVTKRIPVYSAGRFMRDPNLPEQDRPSSNWDHLALGLCLDANTDIAAIANQSFYSNIDSVAKANYEYCSTFQALNDYYYGNTQKYSIDRGHLLPNHITNHDSTWQRTTMTLTNIAAQHSVFNQQAWREVECMTYRFLENEIPGEYVNIITGVLGTKLVMNQEDPNKKRVHLPEFYWKAFCYDSDGVTYSWAYIQVNENDQHKSFANYMMTVKQFSNTYLNGQPIFDSKCQDSGAGPWNLVKADWTGYLDRWGCTFG